MIGRIARREFLEARRDRRWLVTLVITWLLFSAAVVSGWQELRTVRQQRAITQDNERERWLNQGETSPHDATHHGLYVFALPTPLAAFDPDVRSFTGEAAFLEGDHPVTFLFRPAADAPAAHRFGEWSVAVIWQTLLPLVMILLTYGVFAREREAGTLRMVLSHPISLLRWLAVKITGRLFFIFALAFFLSVAGFLLGERDVFAVGQCWKLACWLIAILLYGSFWAGLCLLVNLWTRHSATSALFCVGSWLLLVLLLPRLVGWLPSQLFPRPSRAEQIYCARA
jgi:ABC-2 type transport system permease protein